jgi:hypothetical protein
MSLHIPADCDKADAERIARFTVCEACAQRLEYQEPDEPVRLPYRDD